jgi:hypothetical protein
MKHLLLIGMYALAFGCASAGSASSDVTIVPTISEDWGVGTCTRQGGQTIDLKHMLTMTNRSVDVRENGVTRRVRLGLQSVAIESNRGTPNAVIQVDNIGYDLNPKGGIDIVLNFAMVDGVLGVYWRETYQHREYRQGLYRLDHDRIVPWCEGIGGESISDQ